MAKTVGIVNLHSDITFKGLTERRPVASVSYLGRYGIIDFVLSNMSNSNLNTVGILIQDNPRSLFKHLGTGNEWNFNQKKGGISLLYNEKYANNPKYNHDINNLVENIAFIKEANPDYVVVAPAHIVTTMNYNDVIDHHIAIETSDSILHPSASEIFECISGGSFDDQVNSPVVELNYLRFSKVGSAIRCEITSNEDNDIILQLFVVRKNVKYLVDVI